MTSTASLLMSLFTIFHLRVLGYSEGQGLYRQAHVSQVLFKLLDHLFM